MTKLVALIAVVWTSVFLVYTAVVLGLHLLSLSYYSDIIGII